jgi:hypothetical protein
LKFKKIQNGGFLPPQNLFLKYFMIDGMFVGNSKSCWCKKLARLISTSNHSDRMSIINTLSIRKKNFHTLSSSWSKDVVDDDDGDVDEIEGQYSDGERRKFFLLIEWKTN